MTLCCCRYWHQLSRPHDQVAEKWICGQIVLPSLRVILRLLCIQLTGWKGHPLFIVTLSSSISSRSWSRGNGFMVDSQGHRNHLTSQSCGLLWLESLCATWEICGVKVNLCDYWVPLFQTAHEACVPLSWSFRLALLLLRAHHFHYSNQNNLILSQGGKKHLSHKSEFNP